MTGVFFASQNTFILRGKTTFAYPFIQFFLGQCLRGGEMFLIFLPIFFILSPNEFQEVYVFRMLVYRLSLNYVFRTAPFFLFLQMFFVIHIYKKRQEISRTQKIQVLQNKSSILKKTNVEHISESENKIAKKDATLYYGLRPSLVIAVKSKTNYLKIIVHSIICFVF